jgi:hypothetical protein
MQFDRGKQKYIVLLLGVLENLIKSISVARAMWA